MRSHPLLNRAAQAGVRLGIERVRDLLTHLGSPQDAVPSVHVGGTNGKGSVGSMIAACQSAADKRVGLFTSPHLQEVNERIRVAGQPLPDAELTELLEEIHADATRWAAEHCPELPEGQPLTYFELLTVAGFVAFARNKLDLSVVEVGLGGRLDATNVMTPQVSVITTVALDHQDRLGPDLGSIAGEKAGIIQPGVPVVVGRLPQEALRVIRLTALERGAPLHVLGEDFHPSGSHGDFVVGWADGGISEVTVGLAGAHQLDNAAVAIRALSLLPPLLRVPDGAIREGMAQVHHAGRLEWLGERVLVDGAHNPAGATALAAALDAMDWDQPRTLLLGASDDKDVRAIASILAPQFGRILTTHCAHDRARKAGELAQDLVDLDIPVMPAGPIEEALPLALSEPGLVVVAGSLFTVGAARDLLG